MGKSTIFNSFLYVYQRVLHPRPCPGDPPKGSPYFVPPRRHERKNPGGRGGRHFVGSGFAGLQRSTPPVFIEIERKPMEFPLLNCQSIYVVGRKKVSGRRMMIPICLISWIFSQLPHSLHLQRTFYGGSLEKSHGWCIKNKSII